MITAAELREIIDYEPSTGALIWRVQKGRSSIGSRAGRLRADGYVSVKINQRPYMAHRLIWLWTLGCWPTEIDHINGNRADNRIENLRDCTRSQNFANRTRSANRALPKGVGFDPRGKSFRARITINYHEINLGCFPTAEEAAAAYMAAAKEHYGEFASDGSNGGGEIVHAGRDR